MASTSSQVEGIRDKSQSSIDIQKNKRTNDQLYSEVRLFVANLNTSVTEHDLLITFRQFGTLKQLNLVFHKAGPNRGQPRGYAFIEFSHPDQASKAKQQLDGKPLRGKEMHIGFASINDHSDQNLLFRESGKQKSSFGKDRDESSLPSSFNRNKDLSRNDTTDSRIAAMEAKLQAMRDRQKGKQVSTSSSSSSSNPKRPSHLPPKPMSDVKR